MRRQHEAWLDEAVPALDGRTPRQAAADPVLRRRLVSLLKARIRTADRVQRTNGKGEDPSFLVRALGLSEIDVPPPAGLYDAQSSDPEEEDTRTLLPFLPRSPLTLKQIEARLSAVMQAYPEAKNVLDAFDEDAPELCDWLDAVTESLDDALMDIMMVTAAQAWFMFFPPGCRPGTPDVQRLSQELQFTMERIEAVAQVDDERGFNACVSSTRQPELSAMLQSMAYHMLESGTPDALEQDGGGKIVLISLVLRCLIDELDRTVREA